MIEDNIATEPRFPDNIVTDVNIHRGFRDAVHDVWDQVTEVVDHDQDRGIWLTGHSLGGALATITAMRLHNRIKGLYTYGCPAVGGDGLAEFFDRNLSGKVFRYINDNDLVAKIMTDRSFSVSGYKHVGQEVKLTTNKIRSPFEYIPDRLGLDIIDHSPLFYLLGTRKNIAQQRMLPR